HTVRLRGVLIAAQRVVEGVLVVRERRVADAEAAPDNRLLAQPIGQAQARRKIVEEQLAAQVRRIAPDAGLHQSIGGVVIIRPAPGLAGRGRDVKLPAEPKIQRQLARGMPRVLAEEEQLRLAPRARERGNVAPYL